MANKYVLDTSAWLEYFEDAKHAGEIENLLLDKKNEIFTSIISVVELATKFAKRGMDVKEPISDVELLSKILGIDVSTAVHAAEIYTKTRQDTKNFGLADAIIQASAESAGAIMVTTDHHFKNLKNVILLE